MCHNLRSFVILAIIFCLIAGPTKASRINDVAKYIRSKVIQEEAYEFGSDREFTLQDDKAILLKVSDNVDGIDKILICLTEHFYNSRIIYIFIVLENRESKAGGRHWNIMTGHFV